MTQKTAIISEHHLGQSSWAGLYRTRKARGDTALQKGTRCLQEIGAVLRSFEQAREALIEKLSERLLKLLLEIKQMEMERLLPYTIISVSDLTDDLSTAHYVYLSRNPGDREPLGSSIREEMRKLSRNYPEQLPDGGHVILPREYDMTFIVGFINHFYGRKN